MTYDELIDRATELAEEAINNAAMVTPEALGLDPRCAATLFVGDDFIAVDTASDKRLQYYGGFEYEREYRRELGDYVFYSTESSRLGRLK